MNSKNCVNRLIFINDRVRLKMSRARERRRQDLHSVDKANRSWTSSDAGGRGRDGDGSLSRMHHHSRRVCNIIVTCVMLLVSKAAAARHSCSYDERAPGTANVREWKGRRG